MRKDVHADYGSIAGITMNTNTEKIDNTLNPILNIGTVPSLELTTLWEKCQMDKLKEYDKWDHYGRI